MSFTRTESGLTNAALFFRVDKVVYVEGKPQESPEDPGSMDVIFWQKLFSEFAPGMNVQITCKGSKSDLLPIAREICEGRAANAIVAMDRDFDPEVGVSIEHPSVIYTYGYSWESDVWRFSTIENIIQQNSLVRPVPSNVLEKIARAFDEFGVVARRVARVNLAAAKETLPFVIQKSDYKGLVDVKSNKPPALSRSFLIDRVSRFNRTKDRKVYLNDVSVDARKHCLGHLTAFYGFHLACSVLKDVGYKGKVEFGFLTSIAVNSMDLRPTVGDPGVLHYRYSIEQADGVC